MREATLTHARVPLEVVSLVCIAASVWAGHEGPVTARATFIVSAGTVVAVCQLHQWFTRWSWRTGNGFPSWGTWLWGASLLALACSSALASWWVASLQPSAASAEGYRLGGWASAVIALWTLAPWTDTPAGRTLSSIISASGFTAGRRDRGRPSRRVGDRLISAPVFAAGPRDPAPDYERLKHHGRAVVTRGGRCRLVRMDDVEARAGHEDTRHRVRQEGWWVLGRPIEIVDASYALDEATPLPIGVAAVTVGGEVIGLLDDRREHSVRLTSLT